MTTTTNTAANKAAALIKAMTTRQLIDTFIVSDTNDDPHVYIVRGWIMDELERRNPEAFDAWLESDDSLEGSETLYKYFPC
jgi:hypothetical protein